MHPIVVFLLDGLADRAHESLGGRSGLEAARTQNFDRLCAAGSNGVLYAVDIDQKMTPGDPSDDVYTINGAQQGVAAGQGAQVAQVSLTTSWQLVTVTYTTKSPGSTLDFQSYVTSPAPGNAFYADDVSIVLG